LAKAADAGGGGVSAMIDRDAFADLLAGRRQTIILGADRQPRQLLSGAFDPLHDGHRQMARLAQLRSGQPTAFELSLTNVDKPPLSWEQANRRAGQFGPAETLVLTNAPRFVEKAAAVTEVRFVVGLDTILRVADPRYWGSPAEHRRQLELLASRTRGFLVFGRLLRGRFQTLHDIQLPPVLQRLCEPVDEASFRMDISSTQLRKSQAGGL
jgi:nicotinic acid mononucleotide adenylyltransferase